MSTSELQALFSNLRPRSQQQAVHPVSPSPGVLSSSPQPSPSFFTSTQVPSSTPPPFTSNSEDRAENDAAINSNPPRPASGNPAAQNLLNLLNHGSTRNTGSLPHLDSASHKQALPEGRPSTVSASDLVARFMSPVGKGAEHIAESAPGARNNLTLNDTTSNSLLGTFNSHRDSGVQEVSDRNEQAVLSPPQMEPVDNNEVKKQNVPTAIGTPSSAPKKDPLAPAQKPIFTYTNPFDALNPSRSHTPNVSTLEPQSGADEQHQPFVFEASAELRASSAAEISSRRKLTPKLRSRQSGLSPSPDGRQVPSAPADSRGEGNSESPTKLENPEEPSKAPAEQPAKPEVPAQDDEHQGVKDDTGSGGEWEDLPDKMPSSRVVPVFNFPIKAFVSMVLDLRADLAARIRPDGVMEISRLKKDFDQLDRSLAAATSKYITYAFTKNGGLRIIRQDDGSDRHVFKNSHDRIFNVALCSTAVNAPPSEHQAVIGTGVSGAVYYATISREGNDLFDKHQLDVESLIFPPWPQADDNTAGGVLKTRAKRSSRHPEFFAIGRGKSIHLVWPATALSSRYGIDENNRKVDIERFYRDRALQIQTGKAGKDFTFSEDDTMIVSLDKTGRLRFWDIQTLVDEITATASRLDPVVIDTPAYALATASPAEKSWPTSVLFLDKGRPYNKGGPLRYVLVGLRQNHTLQLWDIALGKAVQELNFPHESETDGICSVNYHPSSGIIVLSHPTRNSIFFIHLSAPKYTLSPSMSQASYVSRIASRDTDLPKPDSTACMSGIREISFAEKGELRSVELLAVHKPTDSSRSPDDSAPLFELYVVHSKGVTCLAINKEDLGWNADSKVVYAIDALKENVVKVKDLKLGSVIEEPARSKSPPRETSQQPTKATKKKAKKAGLPAEDVTNGTEESTQMAHAAPAEPISHDMLKPATTSEETAPLKEVKKSKKKPVPLAENVHTEARTVSPQKHDQSTAQMSTTSNAAPNPIDGRSGSQQHADEMTTEWLDDEVKKIERAVSSGFKRELDNLRQSISDDRIALDQQSNGRHEAVLRLVSSSLTNNTEKSLARIISQQIQEAVVPALIQSSGAHITEAFGNTLRQMLPHEMASHLPASLSSALQNTHMTRNISDALSHKLSTSLAKQVADDIITSLTPSFETIALKAAEQASAEMEARLSAQLQQLELERAADNQKFDRLTRAVEGMATTLHAMSESQVAFQQQILKERQQVSLQGPASAATPARQVSTARDSPASSLFQRSLPAKVKSKAEIELEEITVLMNNGKYEEGSIRWLQSTQPVQLFDDLFVRFTPEYLATDVSPLVAFSVAVTVANSLSTNLERRLEWISAAFDAVDTKDPEIADLAQHAPALITSLVQKLESLYMSLAERNPSDPVLRVIPSVAKKGREMRSTFLTRIGNVGVPPLSLA